MAAKRHKPEEIVSKLRQVDVGYWRQGKSRIDAIRQIGEPRSPTTAGARTMAAWVQISSKYQLKRP